MNIKKNEKNLSVTGAKVTINGEPLIPNEPTTESSTETPQANTPEEQGQVPGDTLEVKEKKQRVSEEEVLYARELAERIYQAGKVSKVKVVSVHEDDFEKLGRVGLITEGFTLRESGQTILVNASADVTGTFWDKTGE
jgi:hypothetical protein